MKRIISNIKIINAIYNNGKMILSNQVAITLFSIVMWQVTSCYIYLFLITIIPSMYTYLYLKVYEPIIRKVEDEINRELKYEFLSNRFNKLN